MMVLEVLEGNERGRRFTCVRQQALIGRSPNADIQLSDPHLSAEHGLVLREQGRFIYRDLRSTNGSMLIRGGTRRVVAAPDAQETFLENGDQLLLGDANQPVVLHCELHTDTVANDTSTQRILATRRLEDLNRLSAQLEHGPDVSRLYASVKQIGGQLDLEQTLQAANDAVLQLLPRATHVAIALGSGPDVESYQPTNTRSRSGESADQVAISRALLQRVLQEHTGVLVADAAEELSASASVMAANIRSTIAVPLWHGDQLVGVIQADNRAGSALFTEGDLDLLMVLAEHAGLAIDNARLYQQLMAAQERIEGENSYLKRRQARPDFDQIVATSDAMQAVLKQIDRVAEMRITVCISGETGTGKELVAQAIHQRSQRHERTFVATNCAAMPESLLESELFGHKRGAFTGADRDKKGLFELADGSTLFLDEIGELPLQLQPKLLRALQEGEVRPVGSTRSSTVDVRIVCATNRQLEQEVKAGRFREDLYYRLNVFPIVLPPLRDRREDIPPLVRTLLRRYSTELGKPIGGIAQPALQQLCAYAWPGNVRELENEIQRLMIQVDPGEMLQLEHLSPQVRRSSVGLELPNAPQGTLKDTMDAIERQLLVAALAAHGNNKTQTAASLGITREGLHKKLARHGI